MCSLESKATMSSTSVEEKLWHTSSGSGRQTGEWGLIQWTEGKDSPEGLPRGKRTRRESTCLPKCLWSQRLTIKYKSHTQKGLPLSSPQLYSHTECQQMVRTPCGKMEVYTLEKLKGNECYRTQETLCLNSGWGSVTEEPNMEWSRLLAPILHSIHKEPKAKEIILQETDSSIHLGKLNKPENKPPESRIWEPPRERSGPHRNHPKLKKSSDIAARHLIWKRERKSTNMNNNNQKKEWTQRKRKIM